MVKSNGNRKQFRLEDKDDSISDSDIIEDDPDRLKITNLETLMHILKGNLGTGIIALPFGFKNAGLTLGTVGLVFIVFLCTYCMHLLLTSARLLSKRFFVPWIDYPDAASLAFTSGPISLQKYSKTLGRLTKFFIITAQLGFCCVFIIFITSSFQMVTDYYEVTWLHELSIQGYMTIFLPFFVVINYIRSLKHLAIISTISNLLLMGSLILMFYYILRDIPNPSSRRQVVSNFSQLPLWFGTTLFACTGIGLVLPLEMKMRNRKDMGGVFGVLNRGMILVGFLFVSVGFFGYNKYGDDSLGSITLNLPPEEITAQICKITFALALYLTYPLQFYVPIQLILPTIEKRISNRRHRLIMDYLIRTALVLLTFALALLIPKLGLFISLVGAFTGSYMALIMPPIIHTVVYHIEGRLSTGIIVRNFLISLFGVIGLITGTYTSIKDIIEAFSSVDQDAEYGIDLKNLINVTMHPIE